MNKIQCSCGHTGIDKGRAFDGRRAYRCQECLTIWTNGLQNRSKKFSKQRIGYQFYNSQSRWTSHRSKKIMPKFKVNIDWSGYCRGTSSWIVEAENEEDAKENWYLGTEIDRIIVRDDTENEIISIDLKE